MTQRLNFMNAKKYYGHESWTEAFDLVSEQIGWIVKNQVDNVHELVAEQIEIQICDMVLGD